MPKVIVAMSGGVDSSVVAALLTQQNYQVEGLFMKNWEEDDGTEYCTSIADLADCHAVCDQLGIQLHTVNFAAEYWNDVFLEFLQQLKSNQTPNPDVYCNKYIKFGVLWHYAKQLGADYLATGHYARLDLNHQYPLLKAVDSNKDQTYFLHAVEPSIWRHILFPLGQLTKQQVREQAAKLQLPNANKKDSTGICFIGKRNFQQFISQYIDAKPGTIIDDSGKVIGKHQGLFNYTIGQRKGIGIGGLKEAADKSWYVIDKIVATNQLVVSQNDALLDCIGFDCENPIWQVCEPAMPLHCEVKTRYRQMQQKCIIYKNNDSFQVKLQHPIKSITSGQFSVFYQNEHCLGGAKIHHVIRAIQ